MHELTLRFETLPELMDMLGKLSGSNVLARVVSRPEITTGAAPIQQPEQTGGSQENAASAPAPRRGRPPKKQAQATVASNGASSGSTSVEGGGAFPSTAPSDDGTASGATAALTADGESASTAPASPLTVANLRDLGKQVVDKLTTAGKSSNEALQTVSNILTQHGRPRFNDFDESRDQDIMAKVAADLQAVPQ